MKLRSKIIAGFLAIAAMGWLLGIAGLIAVQWVSRLPKQERIHEFVRQIKDPYHFRCGKFVVTARFAEDGPTLEECLQRIIA